MRSIKVAPCPRPFCALYALSPWLRRNKGPRAYSFPGLSELLKSLPESRPEGEFSTCSSLARPLACAFRRFRFSRSALARRSSRPVPALFPFGVSLILIKAITRKTRRAEGVLADNGHAWHLGAVSEVFSAFSSPSC